MGGELFWRSFCRAPTEPQLQREARGEAKGDAKTSKAPKREVRQSFFGPIFTIAVEVKNAKCQFGGIIRWLAILDCVD